MQLVFENSRNRWEAITEYGEGSVPKAAGFRWQPDVKRWHAPDAFAAVRLKEYADAATQLKLEAAVEAAKATKEIADAKAREAVEASRATTADIEIPCAPGRTFLPYQRAGIAFALARPSCLIGDDMGLGKSGQTIGVINCDESLKKVLVICPASLTRNWVKEFGFFSTRGLSIGIATTKAIPATDVVICTYDVFSRRTPVAETLRDTNWDCLVLDEAHFLKSRDAARTKWILGGIDKKTNTRMPAIKARRRLYLTGTPLTNRPVELWPLIHSLLPKDFPNFMEFAKRYCNAHNNGFAWDFSGSSNLDELQDLLRSKGIRPAGTAWHS